MALIYVLDEHLRGPLWDCVQRHNARGPDQLDAIRVGDAKGIPLGITDPDLLTWAESEARILVSQDRRTLPAYLDDHLKRGHHSPGIFMIRPAARLNVVLEFLVVAAHASHPEEWKDRIAFLP